MNDLRERLREAGGAVPTPERPFERLLERRDRRRRNERIASAIVALALLGAVVGGMAAVLRDGSAGTRPGEGPGLTGGDSGQPSGLGMGAGGYFYEHAVRVSSTGEAREETWWGLDGTGRIRSWCTDPNYSPLPAGRYGLIEFPLETDVSGLSTDPDRLREQLVERSAPGGASPQPDVTPTPGVSAEAGGLWRAVRRLLELPNATPELRWAVSRVAATIDGVEVVPDGTDPVGRDAVLVRTGFEGSVQELFLDPRTLQPMAVVETYGGDETVYRIVVEAGIVSSLNETPTDEQRLFPRPVTDLPEPGRPAG